MKVLFIGNSHTYFNDMPQMFRQICRENAIKAEVTMLSHGGKGLDFHQAQPEVRFNILYGEYDFVVLQHTAHPFGPEQPMVEAAEKIHQWIRQAKAEPVLYMTWSEKGNEAGQPRVAKAYFDLGKRLGAKVAPVGLAWWKVFHERPDLELYHTDGQHASPTGSLLAAYTIFSTITGKKAQADEPLAAAVSRAAYEAVAEHR